MRSVRLRAMMKILLKTYIIGLLVVLVIGQGQDVCYSHGECLQSPYVDITNAPSPKDCSAHCDSLNDDEDTCFYFTHYASTGDCYAFQACTAFSSNTCSDCVSGPRLCDSEYLCGLPGQCQSDNSPLVETTATNEESCLAMCKDDQLDCNWYTYFSSSQVCSLWQSCSVISSQECTDCTYGQELCPVIGPQSNYIMVLGGEEGPLESYYRAVIIRLETEEEYDEYCYTDISVQFEFGETTIYGMQEHFVVLDGQGSPVACSGLIGTVEVVLGDELYPVGRNCFTPVLFLENPEPEHDMRNTTYDMLQERIGAFSLLLDDGRYWIIGGSEASAETELYIDGIFSPGPTLPENLDCACAANIGGNKVIISGGMSLERDISLNSVYQYDFGTNVWTQLNSMSQARHGHSCGTRVIDGGLEFHAVGGVGAETTAEVYDVATGRWSTGVPYPDELRYGSSLPYKNSFLVIGGRNVEGNLYYDSIRLLTDDTEWFEIGEMISGLAQTAAVYLSTEEVSQYGCTRIL